MKNKAFSGVIKGHLYYHAGRGKACRVVNVDGDNVEVKFHRDGFTWNPRERVVRGPDGKRVSLDESREYAVVSVAELVLATREQIEQYLGSKKVARAQTRPEVGI